MLRRRTQFRAHAAGFIPDDQAAVHREVDGVERPRGAVAIRGQSRKQAHPAFSKSGARTFGVQTVQRRAA